MRIELVGECDKPHEMTALTKEEFVKYFGIEGIEKYDFERYNYSICENCRRLFTFKNETK